LEQTDAWQFLYRYALLVYIVYIVIFLSIPKRENCDVAFQTVFWDDDMVS